MLRIGLTGGIGSGKSTVAKIFESFDIPVYYADDRAKFLMHHDVDLKNGLLETFGHEVWNDEGLNRALLAEIVFNDDEQLRKLNSLVHPAVGRDYRAWCETTQGEAPYSIKEAAILFETGGDREMDRVILVTAPEDVRIERVMKRDEVSEESVRSRMAKQWKDEEKIPLADHIIDNSGDESLILQVQAIDKALRAAAF